MRRLASWNAASPSTWKLRGRGDLTSMISAMRPGRGDITTTRSASTTASVIECVTNSTVLGRSPQIRSSSMRHLLAGQRIERAERLVHQQDVGLVHQRPADRHALLHAARQFARRLAFEAREPDQLQQRRGLVGAARVHAPHHAQREQHVVEHAGPRQQGRRLEDDAGLRPRFGDRLAADRRRCPRSAGSGRRRCAAASTCRSPTARPG